ncbi:hypothetical protein JK358_11900 [Nocardia sp. 2]|uniref:Lipoprotein n=1 Tax=Nocardia acididurans TaxID=2802282 RepID=A0ABS1M436_9NOCA|nr:hypothetical protein [Nocardia acididurans]MBL1075096.1 hypothetical protein [Nocardia acididurans]
MSSRTATVGVAVSVIGATLLLAGCHAAAVDAGPSSSAVVAASTTAQAPATIQATLSPSIIGQAEKHHTAVLARALAGTTLDEHQWIVLNQAVAAGGPVERSAHIARIAAMTQWNPVDIEAALSALLDSALLRAAPGGLVEPTETGTTLAGEVRTVSGAIVQDAYSVVTPEDLATTARVLTAITARMAAELDRP